MQAELRQSRQKVTELEAKKVSSHSGNEVTAEVAVCADPFCFCSFRNVDRPIIYAQDNAPEEMPIILQQNKHLQAELEETKRQAAAHLKQVDSLNDTIHFMTAEVWFQLCFYAHLCRYHCCFSRLPS